MASIPRPPAVSPTPEGPASAAPSPAPVPAALPPRSPAFGIATIAIGTLVAAWMTAGRALFGVAGEMVPWFAATILPVMAGLCIAAGAMMLRAARRGHPLRPATRSTMIVSWVLGLLFGLMVPDTTADGLASVLSVLGGPVALEIGIGLCNPLGIVAVVLAVFSLALAFRDSQGPRRRSRWSAAYEDEDEEQGR